MRATFIPLTILSTLPSAGVGALLALELCRMDFSLVALIGVVLLIGIVKKNAIMMIDFALEAQRERGAVAARRDLPGLPASLSPNHDDHSGRPSRRVADGSGNRHGFGTSQSAGSRHRRWPAAVPVSHALHHAGHLSRACRVESWISRRRRAPADARARCSRSSP